MPLSFRSYRSSSAGNCLALWTGDSSILIDCGVKTLRDCRALLEEHQAAHGKIDGVLVTHVHGDHCTLDALRALGEAGIPVHAHRRVVPQLHARHGPPSSCGCGTGGRRSIVLPPIRAFGDLVSVGAFDISAIELAHAPGVPNVGFVIGVGRDPVRRTVVVATDFHDTAALAPHLPGADFVFVEANHDEALLRQHPNPNSRYHLDNVETARLLCSAVTRGGFSPHTVVLGHLSDARNREGLAVGEVARVFASEGLRVPFHVEAAPKFVPSRIYTIG